MDYRIDFNRNWSKKGTNKMGKRNIYHFAGIVLFYFFFLKTFVYSMPLQSKLIILLKVSLSHYAAVLQGNLPLHWRRRRYTADEKIRKGIFYCSVCLIVCKLRLRDCPGRNPIVQLWAATADNACPVATVSIVPDPFFETILLLQFLDYNIFAILLRTSRNQSQKNSPPEFEPISVWLNL